MGVRRREREVGKETKREVGKETNRQFSTSLISQGLGLTQ